jgi:predicted GNAT family N-acyltransferase
LTLRIISVTAGAPDFSACFAIRLAVFVEEQGVSLAEEQDGQDDTALHFLAFLKDMPAGTARVILKDSGAAAKITRVAVLHTARGNGIGAALIRHIEAEPALSGIGRFMLDAQTHALAFYERLGYAALGAEFMEAGIPHQHMQKLRNPFDQP